MAVMCISVRNDVPATQIVRLIYAGRAHVTQLVRCPAQLVRYHNAAHAMQLRRSCDDTSRKMRDGAAYSAAPVLPIFILYLFLCFTFRCLYRFGGYVDNS